MRSMGPTPRPLRPLCSRFWRRRPAQGVRCGTPLSGSLLPGQHKAACAGAGELHEKCRDMPATASLWIDHGRHRLSEGSRFNGPLAVVLAPRFEQLYNLTTMWIVGLYLIKPVDGVATAKCQEWIAD